MLFRSAPALPRTALLTGVGRRRGIGAAIARGLAEDGCDLALSFHGEYDRRVLGEDADVELLAEELRGLGRRVVLLPGDKPMTPPEYTKFVGDFATIRWGIQKTIGLEIIRYGDPDGGGDLVRVGRIDLAARQRDLAGVVAQAASAARSVRAKRG